MPPDSICFPPTFSFHPPSLSDKSAYRISISMATILESLLLARPPLCSSRPSFDRRQQAAVSFSCAGGGFPCSHFPVFAAANSDRSRFRTIFCKILPPTAFAASRREVTLSTLLSGVVVGLFSAAELEVALHPDHTLAQAATPTNVFKEYIDTFDGYSFKYPQTWIPVRGAGADIFFRDPFILDENLSVNISSPSSSTYKSVEDLGTPEEAGERVLKQYLTEFMSTRLGVRRESKVLSTSSRVADDGRMYYQVEVNIKSYANNNEMAVMPQDRVARLEWDRRYLSVLGVENNRLYELRLQAPERMFKEDGEILQVMDSFRVNKVTA